MNIDKQTMERVTANIECIRFLLDLNIDRPMPEFVTSAREIAIRTRNMLTLQMFGQKDDTPRNSQETLCSEVMAEIAKYVLDNKRKFPRNSSATALQDVDDEIEGVIDDNSVFIKRTVFNRIINDSGKSVVDILLVLRNNGQIIINDSQRGFEKVKWINGKAVPCINLKLCIGEHSA